MNARSPARTRACRRADRLAAWRHAADVLVGWAALAAGLLLLVMLLRVALACSRGAL